MAALRAELDGGGETDAAMAFLATAIKDHGAVPASNVLFRWVACFRSACVPYAIWPRQLTRHAFCHALCRRALELKPSSPSYALNLMHGLELDQEYGTALQLALDFCKATK